MTRRIPGRVTVLGAGSWGTTFGKILADGGSQVTMWARRDDVATQIRDKHRNSEYLPNVPLPASMTATSDLRHAVS
ncbi:MAG: 2-dehydropantoate 2-reductase N-terminal domain-containing protein, partial [Mycetocola sp.]